MFGIVGSGWRADFFARLAALLPGRLTLAGAAVRRADSVEEVAHLWSVPVYLSPTELTGIISSAAFLRRVAFPRSRWIYGQWREPLDGHDTEQMSFESHVLWRNPVCRPGRGRPPRPAIRSG